MTTMRQTAGPAIILLLPACPVGRRRTLLPVALYSTPILRHDRLYNLTYDNGEDFEMFLLRRYLLADTSLRHKRMLAP